MSLAEARERHLEGRKLLSSGVDPIAVRKQAEFVTVEKAFWNLAKLWLEHWREGKSTRHVETTARRLALNVLPALGAKQIDRIEGT